MNWKSVLIISFVFLLSISVLGQKSVESQINSYISNQANKKLAVEYKEARKIINGDLIENQSEEIVLIYTLESINRTNNYLQFLAVFEQNKLGKLKFITQEIIGGKNNRIVESIIVKNKTINLDTLNYSTSDASCCPSQKGKTQFLLTKNKLKEIKNKWKNR